MEYSSKVQSGIKVIVCGSRDFEDYERLKKWLDHLFSLRSREEITIITGGARGADSLGYQYAIEKRISSIVLQANWDKYGKRAGPIRNEEMAKIATHCVAFWDGISPGTSNMIGLAKKYNLITKVMHPLANENQMS